MVFPETAHLVTLAGNPVLAGDSAKRVKQIFVGDRNNHAPFLKIMTIHIRYLAALIDGLSLSDQEKLAAIMESGCDEVSDIDDLVNLTFNLDCYDIMHGINDKSDLGYYYAHEAGIYSEKNLGPLANYKIATGVETTAGSEQAGTQREKPQEKRGRRAANV